MNARVKSHFIVRQPVVRPHDEREKHSTNIRLSKYVSQKSLKQSTCKLESWAQTRDDYMTKLLHNRKVDCGTFLVEEMLIAQ